MTNLEWLKTLSAEELANKLHERPVCQFCVNYNYKSGCMFSIVEDDESHCVEGMTAWLKAEHKEELKPCPFCGAEGDFINHDSNVFWVQCTNCGSHGRQSKTKEGAITAWNRRVNDGRSE